MKKTANDAACNWWLFISPFLNKIIKTLIKQHCHFTLYHCPRAVKEDSPTRLSFFCLMFTSLASELTPNRLILCGSWRCCWQTRSPRFNGANTKKQPPTGWAHLGRRFHKHSIWKLEARLLLFWHGDPDLPGFFFLYFPSHSSIRSRKRHLGGHLPPRAPAGRKLLGTKKKEKKKENPTDVSQRPPVHSG